MAIFFVAAIWPSSRDARRLADRIVALAACAALFVAATIYAGTSFFQVCYPEDTVASMLVDYHAGAGFEGMYEYEPPDGDISNVPTGLPDACLVTDPTIVLGKPDPDDPDANPAWAPDQGTCQATFAWRQRRSDSIRNTAPFSPPCLTPATWCFVSSAIRRGPSALNGQLLTNSAVSATTA